MKKKIISTILVVVMLICSAPFGGFNDGEMNLFATKASALTGDQRTDIINVAIGQLGNTNGSKYTFGAGNVSWCARQANIDNSIIKTTGWADADDLGVKYYSRGSYTPKKGDIIIFDYPPYSTKTPASAYGDHVGLVEYVEGNYVHTIEGNAGSPNAVRRYSYLLSNSSIKGYGVPNYTSYQVSHTRDTNYGTNFTAYLKNPNTNHYVFDANHNSTGNYVNDTDPCTIHEVYTDGCCRFTYVLTGGGTRTAYGKISWFNTHTHSYSIYGYEKDHPHKYYKKCSCGEYYYTGQTETVKTCVTCCENASYSLSCSVSSVTMKVGETKTVVFIESSSGFTVKITGQCDASRLSASFGSWEDGYKMPLTFTALKEGSTTIEVQLVASLTNKVMKTYSLPVNVVADTYTVSYNANGGTGAPSSQIKTYGKTLTLSSTKPTRTGYTFLGWSTSSTATSATYSAGDSYTANASATLYAVWKENTYTIKYNANNGNGSMSNSTHTYDIAKTLSANTFTRTGYTFLGWSTSSSATTATYTDKQSVKNLTATNGGAVTLYAVWKANTYTVKYNANGGSGSMSNSSHAYDTAKALSANTFTRTGYTFLGWSTSSSATTATYTDKQSVKNLTTTNGGTVTLYAVWKANTYTVKYNANGGSGSMSNSTHTYDIAKALSANIFTRTGYTFLGWSTSSSSTTATYTDKQSVKNLTATNGGTVTLYAVWQRNPEPVNIANIKVLNATASPGGTVSVKVAIENNPGIAYLKLKIGYDKNAMTLTSVNNLNIIDGLFQSSQRLSDNPYIIVWSNNENSDRNGNIVTLTFKINDNIAFGDYFVTVENAGCNNSEENKVNIQTKNGKITVDSVRFGDVNGDGEIDGRDSTLLMKYLAEWDVSISEKAADVNNDGEIDGRDSTLLMKYLAEWDVALG